MKQNVFNNPFEGKPHHIIQPLQRSKEGDVGSFVWVNVNGNQMILIFVKSNL